MNDPYDEDDNYSDDYYDHDNLNKNHDKYKWYFKFDVNQSSSLSDWILNHLNNMFKNDKWTIDKSSGYTTIQFPVNDWNPSAGSDLQLQYLGSNYQEQEIWKTKYSISQKLNTEYKNHLKSHAAHFIQQPNYYQCMFDILN